MPRAGSEGGVWAKPRLVERLRVLAERGSSAGVIALVLTNEFSIEVSRSAVKGKLSRLKLARGASTECLPQRVRRRQTADTAVRTRKARPTPREKTREEILALPPLSIEEGGGRWTKGCQWPYGDPRDERFTFCGRAKCEHHNAYCADHAYVSRSGATTAERDFNAAESAA